MKRLFYLFIGICSLLFFSGCGSSTSDEYPYKLEDAIQKYELISWWGAPDFNVYNTKISKVVDNEGVNETHFSYSLRVTTIYGKKIHYKKAGCAVIENGEYKIIRTFDLN